MHDIVEVRADDRLAWVEPGLFNLDLSTALQPTRLHLRARPVVAADLVDRREREHQRRRPALPGVRRHVGARARAGRRDAGRDRRAPGERGTRDGRLRPARRRRGLGGNARRRRARLRAADAAPTRRAHDAARLHGRERLRRDRVGDHRSRRRPGGGRDDGSRHHRGRRELRARRLPDRRRGDPHRRGRRAPVGRGGADPRGRGRRTREPRPHDPGRGRRRGASAAVEGTQVRVRRGRPDRAALPPARLRRPAHQARSRC